MKHIKKLLLTITALALILSMHSGCGMFTNYKAIAEKALEKKYGEEFVCHYTWNEASKQCYAELSPAYDETMRFYAVIGTKSKSSFHDTYPEAIVGKQIADIIYKETKNIWNECCVFVSINDQSLDFTNKNDVSIESFYQKAGTSLAPEPYIHIAVNEDELNYENYDNEYDTILKLGDCIGVDKMYMRLYFINDDAYQEYKTHFSSTHDIYGGDFQYRDDFKQRITIKIDHSTQEYSMTKDDYIKERELNDVYE